MPPRGQDKRMQLTRKGNQKMAEKTAAETPRRKDHSEGFSNTKVALVDLFAGLRTVHVATPGVEISVVVSHAAEKCPFANSLAKKNGIKEKVFKDVRDMDEGWEKSFIDEAIEAEAAFAVIWGGSPARTCPVHRVQPERISTGRVQSLLRSAEGH